MGFTGFAGMLCKFCKLSADSSLYKTVSKKCKIFSLPQKALRGGSGKNVICEVIRKELSVQII